MAEDGKMLYIVDDSPLIIERIEALLEDSASIRDIRSACSYPEAIKLLGEKEPDIVLLDIHLNERNGIDLLRYLRDAHPSTTVIMLSNQATAHYRSLCKALGAAHFIDKSTEFDDLPDLLASLP
ncbi:MAG: response regulator transcription factor [Bacteroidota bacterium]|nr:response regulator transcription factor [Bacteroidota bacterium]MDP4248254.1 response regulator transcription factor [Bacteroidota bacterium]MDP4256507.1 response regulator transcription factor [Bacteroidota bacterium]MDP4259594.1 response regulator transcription factor [Bacteroidota bacterium]